MILRSFTPRNLAPAISDWRCETASRAVGIPCSRLTTDIFIGSEQTSSSEQLSHRNFEAWQQLGLREQLISCDDRNCAIRPVNHHAARFRIGHPYRLGATFQVFAYLHQQISRTV